MKRRHPVQKTLIDLLTEGMEKQGLKRIPAGAEVIKIQEMYKVAGRDLVNRMMQALEKEENCTKWFYSPDVALGNKSPYKLCKEGKKSELYKLLDLIEHEVFYPNF